MSHYDELTFRLEFQVNSLLNSIMQVRTNVSIGVSSQLIAKFYYAST
jgi:hypothetical protein